MHVRIFHQYYRTPGEGGALRTWYMGKYLSDKGHTVSVITGGNISGYHIKEEDGMEVHYLPIYYSNHLGFISRVHAFWLFVKKAVRLARELPGADVNYILTTPLTTGIIGLRLRKSLNIPYVFEVGDIWPEAPRQLGVLRNMILLRLARRLEKKSYEGATALVGLSPEIADYLESSTRDKPVYCIPNVSDIRFFHPANNDTTSKPFVISYIGTLGKANHLEFLLHAARTVPDELDVRINIMGDGAQGDSLKAQAAGMTNVFFHEHGNRDQVGKLLEQTDAVYVSFMDVPVLTSGSPNKLFDGLAAGKLMIINFQGWLKDLVEENVCGFYYPPRQPEILWNELESFIQDPDRLEMYKQNARRLAEEKFSPERIFQVLDKLLKEINPSDSAH